MDGDISNLIKDDVEVDWYLLDAALAIELEEMAQLQSKKRASDSFCGPERSFPVNDYYHVTAARRLIGRAKLSDSQREKFICH